MSIKALSVTFFVFLFALYCQPLYAKSKAQKFEASFVVGHTNSLDIDGQQGSKITIDSDYGYGFSFSYYYTEQFALTFDWLFSTQDYMANIVDKEGQTAATVSHEADITHSQLNLTYYFSPEAFSFYAQAGLGGSYLDSNIISSPPIDVCWWDPWWGYICGDFQDTYSDTRFSYSLTLGARYSLSNDLVLNLGYSQLWMDLANASTSDIGVFKLQIGRLF